MIQGYKAFNNDLTNRYGIKFNVGTIYTATGPVKFGNQGNGFHLCKNMEDTLRYFDGMNGNILIAQVIGSGDYQEYEDNYYGYYDMYVTEILEIKRILSRDDILGEALSLNEYRLARFLSGYRLHEDEIALFQYMHQKSPLLLKTIDYYQCGNHDAFSKETN